MGNNYRSGPSITEQGFQGEVEIDGKKYVRIVNYLGYDCINGSTYEEKFLPSEDFTKMIEKNNKK